MEVIVNSSNTKYSENYIESLYEYQTTAVEKKGSQLVVS